MEAKTKKIIVWVSLGILIAATVGVAVYFVIKTKENKTEDTNTPPVLVQHDTTGLKSTIQVETTSESKARAIQFDVGQADCGLVQISKDNDFKTREDNFNILIDVGVELPKNDDKNGAMSDVKTALCDKIYNEFVTNVDLIVFSHMHFDHIGAASQLLNDNRFTFNNTTALFNWAELRYTANSSKGLNATTKTLMKGLEDKNIQLADSNYWANLDSPNNKIVDFGGDNYFSVLGGTDVQIKNNPNAWSVVNRFNWNGQSILYTGDLAGKLDPTSNIAIDIPSKHYDELNCDILKAPHHGSATDNSNGLPFVQAVSPNQVWISASQIIKYTLPDVTALNNYLAAGVTADNIWGTEQFGVPTSSDPKWKSLNDWVKEHPTANNNNAGYGNIIKEF